MAMRHCQSYLIFQVLVSDCVHSVIDDPQFSYCLPYYPWPQKKSLRQNTPESSFGENGKIPRLREGDGEQWGWWEKEGEEEKEGVM